MMKQVVIRIEEGSFELGFRVSLKFLEDGRTIAEEFNLQLPPNPDFPRVYDEWRSIYTRLGLGERVIEINEGQTTNFASLEECENATRKLESNERNWLGTAAFEVILGRIFKKFQNFTPSESVRVIINTSNPYLHRLSWDYWDLFSSLPRAEFALLSQYNPPKTTWQQPIRILAIFGSDRGGLQLKQDRELIENLERHGAKITPIPAKGESLTPKKLYQSIREGNWDIIFYAGHSSDRTVNVNSTLNVPIDALEGAFKKAAPKVKLAIFNSCDGLGIGEYLAKFNIPNMIVMRERVPDLVARNFLQDLLDEFTQGQPLHVAVKEAREHLEYLELENSDRVYHPRASKLPVLIQNPNTPELYWPSPGIIRQIIDILRKGFKFITQPFRNRRFSRGLILFLLALIVVFGISRLPKPEVIGDNISIGEEILLSKPRDKQRGVKAVAKCQKPWNYFLPIWKSHIREQRKGCFGTKNIYQEAVQNLQQSWKTDRRDPETLIYLNNALLEATKANNFYTIAVAVPALQDETGINTELAEEILRGVAQAQTEVNLSLFNEDQSSNLTLPGADFLDPKNLNGKGLKVIIANDANKEKQAKEVANQIVKRSDVLGLVGHWTSEMTMATVDIYNQNELVMVSPGTSTSELTKQPKPFFFRVSSNNYVRADAAVDVLMRDPINQNKATIFYNDTSAYSNDYKKRFETTLIEKGGYVIDSFDIYRPNFNAKNAIQKVRKYDNSAIVLVPDGQVTDSFANALEIIKENGGQNWIVGDSSIYSPKTLNIAQLELLEKLIVTINWHPLSNPTSDFSDNFPENSEQLWGGPVSNRTALSYDATQVLIKGIEKNEEKPRREIQKILAGKKFDVEGVTGEIKFQPGTGDRQKQPLELVKVVPCPRNKEYGFAFIPVEYQDVESICSVPG
ncbi:MAG: ABC transporter substrate-binding protein [Cyanobacteriota bacterium]|nr:ABC transporter substrate-binding protein [Cyanobacteriota bacterium]